MASSLGNPLDQERDTTCALPRYFAREQILSPADLRVPGLMGAQDPPGRHVDGRGYAPRCRNYAGLSRGRCGRACLSTWPCGSAHGGVDLLGGPAARVLATW